VDVVVVEHADIIHDRADERAETAERASHDGHEHLDCLSR